MVRSGQGMPSRIDAEATAFSASTAALEADGGGGKAKARRTSERAAQAATQGAAEHAEVEQGLVMAKIAQNTTTQPKRTSRDLSIYAGSSTHTTTTNSATAVQLVATFEVAIYVNDFFNVDLFQQGHYAIRLSVTGAVDCGGQAAAPDTTTNSTPCSTPRASSDKGTAAAAVARSPTERVVEARPIRVVGDVKTKDKASTHVGDRFVRVRPVRIKYTHENHNIDELVCFELNLPVPNADAWKSASATVKVELLFLPAGKDRASSEAPCDPDKLEVVATSHLRVPNIADGVHAFFPMNFDEWHFARSQLVIHAVPVGARAQTATEAATAAAQAAAMASPRPRSSLPASPLAFFQRRSTVYAPSPAPATPMNMGGDFEEDGRRDLDPYQANVCMDMLASATSATAAYLSALPSSTFADAAQTASALAASTRDTCDAAAGGFGGPDPATPVPPHKLRKYLRDVSQGAGNAWRAFLAAHEQSAATCLSFHKQAWKESRGDEWAPLVVKMPVDGSDPPVPEMSTTEVLFAAHSISTKRRREAVALRRNSLRTSPNPPPPIEDLQIFGSNTETQPIICLEKLTIGPKTFTESRTPRSSATNGVFLDVDDASPTLSRSNSSSNLGGHHHGHLVVFVHGFQGAPTDLRLVRNHMMSAMPGIDSLMSSSNRGKTFDDLSEMGSRLAQEVNAYVSSKYKTGSAHPLRAISFVGHSIGNIITRAAVSDELFAPLRQHLGFFLSISGPHLGYMFSTNVLFDSGMWLLKNVRRSKSLHQIALTDARDPRDSYLYRLASRDSLPNLFRHIIFVSSPQDRYVPYHSARVETSSQMSGSATEPNGCASASGGNSSPRKMGRSRSQILSELRRLTMIPHATRACDVTRVDVHFHVPKKMSLDRLVGRAAHIDFLETDVWARMVMWLVMPKVASAI